MDDLSVRHRDDRDEPVVIACSTQKNRAVHLVLENHDATIPRAVHNKRVAGVKLDRLAVSREASYQIGSPSNRQRATGEGILGLEKSIFGNRCEIIVGI